MQMDWLRSCYKSSMRLYPDRLDVVTPGQWYFCPPGTRPIPRLIACVSAQWDFEGSPAVTGVGEVSRFGAWDRGQAPHQFQGRHFCGDADAWLNGIPFADRPGLPLDADNVPVCCQALPSAMVISGVCCGCGRVLGG